MTSNAGSTDKSIGVGFNRTEEEQDSTMNERVKTYSKEDFIHPW